MLKLTDNRVVGLTGMSGAGKSTVCRLFAEYGYHVIDCDLSAREVAQAGAPALRELSEKLSPDIIKPDGSLDRQLTSRLIFNDDEKRRIFNKIIYPYITYNIVMKIRSAECDVLLDAPTLFEARIEGLCTDIVSVCADTEICVQRIVKRDGIDTALARARLSSQHGIDFFRKYTDHCIENNGTADELYCKAEEMIRRLKGI